MAPINQPRERVKTKIPTSVVVSVTVALAFGLAVAGSIFLNLWKVNKKTFTTTTLPTTTATTNGIWISPAELAAIPITGEPGCLAGSACATAWNNLKTAACGSWGLRTSPTSGSCTVPRQ